MLGSSGRMVQCDVGPHVAVAVAVAGPAQGGTQRAVGGRAVRQARGAVAEDGGTVERDGGEVVAEVGVRGGDADGAGVQPRAEHGRDDAKARSAGVHLLELEDGLVPV